MRSLIPCLTQHTQPAAASIFAGGFRSEQRGDMGFWFFVLLILFAEWGTPQWVYHENLTLPRRRMWR